MIKFSGITVSRVQLMLFLGDVISIAAAVFLSVSIRFRHDLALGHGYIGDNIWLFLVQGAVLIVCFLVADLYDYKRDFRRLDQVLQIFAACFFGMLISVALFYARLIYIGRGIFFLQGIMVFLLTSLFRVILTTVSSSQQWKKRALVVGAGYAGWSLVKTILENSQCGYWVEGFIDDDPEKQGTVVENKKVLGKSADLLRLALDMRVDMIIICITHRKSAELLKTLLKCHYYNIQVVDMPTVFELITGKLPLKHINDEWLLYSAMSNKRFMYTNIKRLSDVVFSLALLAITLPITVLAAIMIKLTSPGPVIYSQERLGRDYGKFNIYKFRTMVQDAEKDTGAVWATKEDPRVTAVGRYMRKLRIDEIPQLFNVLKGDMSFVGPRPEREVFVKELENEIKAYSHRLVVKPGITGWAQIMYPYASTLEESIEKLRYDLYYVKNMSIILDILIVLKTIRVVLSSGGH